MPARLDARVPHAAALARSPSPFRDPTEDASHWGAMRIGILTGGGDCPGLNAVIRAVVRKGEGVYGDQLVGLPPRVARRARRRDRRADHRRHPGPHPPRRHHPRHVTHQPVPDRRRRGPHGRHPASASASTRSSPSGARTRSASPPRLADEVGNAGRRGAEDDRQRPRRHRLHLRLRDRGADRHRRHRPPAHHRRESRPGDGRGGHGPPRGLDRSALGHRRRRRRRAHARGAVRHRRGVRTHRASPPPRRQLLDRGRRRGCRPAGGHDDAAERRGRRVRTRTPRRHRQHGAGGDRAPHRLRGPRHDPRTRAAGRHTHRLRPHPRHPLRHRRDRRGARRCVRHDGGAARRAHRAGPDRRRGARAEDRRPSSCSTWRGCSSDDGSASTSWSRSSTSSSSRSTCSAATPSIPTASGCTAGRCWRRR